MATRFVVRAMLFLFLAIAGWERLPLADYYHRALARCASHIVRSSDVDNISFANDEFVAHVAVHGRRELLHIHAGDLTMNSCVLAALYFASPRRRRVFPWCCSAAFVSLFALHVIALQVTIRSALAWHENSYGIAADAIAQLGPWMYPVAMLLWAPYVAMYFWWLTPDARGKSAPTSIASGTHRRMVTLPHMQPKQQSRNARS